MSSKITKLLLVESNISDIDLALESAAKVEPELQILLAENAATCIEYLTKRAAKDESLVPDIILIDMKLADKPGDELLRDIRKIAQYEDIPIFMLTTSIAERDVLKSYNLDVSGLILKPLDRIQMEGFIDFKSENKQ